MTNDNTFRETCLHISWCVDFPTRTLSFSSRSRRATTRDNWVSITLMRSFTVYVAINVKPLCVGVRNMETIEDRKSVAESRSRHQIPKRHRGASVAELEAGLISERTKAALAAAKARGVKLGNPNGARALRGKQVGNKEAVEAIKLKAQEHATNLRSILDDIRGEGIISIRKIAEEFDRRGILAPRGGEWQPTTVVRLLARLQVQGAR